MGILSRSDVLGLFGGTGDLARRKLYPALVELVSAGRLPGRVLPVGRCALRDDDIRPLVAGAVTLQDDEDPAVQQLLDVLGRAAVDYGDPDSFAGLAAALEGTERHLLLEVLTLVAMDPPVDDSAQSLRV